MNCGIAGRPFCQKVAASLTCCVQEIAASVVHSLEERPKDTGNTGFLTPAPVASAYKMLWEKRERHRLEVCLGRELWHQGPQQHPRGTCKVAEPSGWKGGNGSHPGMCRETPDHHHVPFPPPEDSGSWTKRTKSHVNIFEVLSPNVPLICIIDFACHLPSHFVVLWPTLSCPTPLWCGLAPLPLNSPEVCTLPHLTGTLLGSFYSSGQVPDHLVLTFLLSWLLKHYPLLIFLLFLCLRLPSSLLVLLPHMQMNTFSVVEALPPSILFLDQCFMHVKWHPATLE